MGVGNREIMWRHILPNSLTPVLAFLPFVFPVLYCPDQFGLLGLGVPASQASLGELLAQGKDNGRVVDRPVCRCYTDGDAAFAGHDRRRFASGI